MNRALRALDSLLSLKKCQSYNSFRNQSNSLLAQLCQSHSKAQFHPEGGKNIMAKFCNYRSYECWEEIQNRNRVVRGESYAPPHDAISFLIVQIKLRRK